MNNIQISDVTKIMLASSVIGISFISLCNKLRAVTSPANWLTVSLFAPRNLSYILKSSTLKSVAKMRRCLPDYTRRFVWNNWRSYHYYYPNVYIGCRRSSTDCVQNQGLNFLLFDHRLCINTKSPDQFC